MGKLEQLFKKIPVKFRWLTFVLIAFSSALSFIHIDSVFADKYNLNVPLLVYGIISGLITCGIFAIAARESAEQDTRN